MVQLSSYQLQSMNDEESSKGELGSRGYGPEYANFNLEGFFNKSAWNNNIRRSNLHT